MIVFCTTCKGRAPHLKDTLPQNLKDNPGVNSKFLILDYSSQDDLGEWIRTEQADAIASGKLVLYQFRGADRFQMAHAKNMAARCGIREGADILVTLDADNFTGQDFDLFVTERLDGPGVFLCPDFPRIKSLPHGPGRPARGYAGRLAIRAQEFLKMGGYCETFDTWRGEDVDMIARLQRTGYTMRLIDNHFLNAIPHNSRMRFREYPEAKQFDNHKEWKQLAYGRTDTVCNYGKIGCGMVYRNFEEDPILFEPIPTRVFGIGMHKTATSSLHAAFKILGFDSFHWETNQKAWDIWHQVGELRNRSMTLEQYYALCDNPIPMLYRELDERYPGSKFVLTVRDEVGWIKSVERLWDPKTNPWYDWNLQPFTNRIHQALYGRTDFDAKTFLREYRQHNAEVLKHFANRPNDLLVMDIDSGAGWNELCGFLGQPIPEVPYPRVDPAKRAF